LPVLRRWFVRIWPFLVLVVAACVVHLPQLLGRRHYFRDVQRLFVPAKFLIAESLRKGELPQWWPYDGGGTAFLAQSNFSVFHPSTLAYLVLPFWTALAFQDFLGTLLAMTGAYVLVRELEGSRPAAFVAAAVFGANGYFASVVEFPFTHLSLGTMPWYVWALLRASRRKSWWFATPAVALALLLLAGDPQVALLAAFAGAVILLATAGVQRTTLLLAVLSPLVGAGLAAIQLVPSMLLVSETNRALPLTEANKWPLELKHIAGFLLPADFGAWAFSASMFLGVASVLAALVTLSQWRDRRIVALWALLLIGLWLSLGDDYGLNAWARVVVPLWKSLRYPIKSMALVTLTVAMLAAAGFDLLRRESSHRLLRVFALALVGAVLLVAAWRIQASAAQPTLWWLAFGASAIALLLPMSRPPVPWVAAGLIAAPLLAQAVLTQQTVEASFYDEPPLAAVLQNAGVGLDGVSFMRLGIAEDTSLARNEGYVATVGGWGGGLATLYHLPTIQWYSPGASLRLIGLLGLKPVDRMQIAWLGGLFGTGMLVMKADAAFGPELGRDPRFDYVVIPNPGALPRAYAVHRGLGVPAFDETVQLLEPSSSFLPGREVLLESEPNPSWSERPALPPVPLRTGHPSNTKVIMEGTLPWPGFAVLNETAASGWSVTVDGQSTEWMAANGMVRAVELPAGTHRVEWTYETPGLVAGAEISVAALVLLALFVVRQRKSGASTGTG
jgi:hypothetical protein